MKLGNNFTRHHPITHMNVVVAGNMLTNVRNFIILQSGEGLTSFNKDNSANFSGTMKLSEVSIFREYTKNLSVKSPTHRRSRLRI